MFNIRFANGNDAFGILDIYSPYVAFSSVTFECDVPRPYEMRRRINTINNIYPWLVCVKGEQIAGYAYASQLFSRAAYAWDAELSVYIRDDCQRCNIASALYYSLIELLKKQGFCNVFARITVPNEKSIAFHKAFGFAEAGHLHNAGFKLGEWHDVKILEKPLLDSFEYYPNDITPITEIDLAEAEAIFRKAEKIIRQN